jgi:hypothetical protein
MELERCCCESSPQERAMFPSKEKQRGLHQDVRDRTELVNEDGAVVLIAAEMEAASPSSFHLLWVRGHAREKGVTMLLDSSFIQDIFSVPGALVTGFMIGTFLGVGSTLLYASLRIKHIYQRVRGGHVPRAAARSMTVMLLSSSVPLAIGVLALVGLLVANVSVTGMMVNWWAVVFVATCGLITLSVHITGFMVRKRRERSRRLEGRGMEGEAQSVRSRSLRQTARSHPQPKEASEEE